MIQIRDLQPGDLPRTVELHQKHLRLGLFPRLGRRFLGEYHLSFLNSPFGMALVAESGQGLEGAIFGTTSNAEHYRWVVRNHGQAFALLGIWSLIRRPRLAWTFLTTRAGRYVSGVRRHLSRKKTATVQGPVQGSEPVSVLHHIVTASSARKQGVGRQLVEEFKALAGARGARQTRLITREDGPGVPFFESVGGTCVSRRQEPDGEPVREYVLPLAAEQNDEPSDRRPGRRDRGYGGRGRRRAGTGAYAARVPGE